MRSTLGRQAREYPPYVTRFDRLSARASAVDLNVHAMGKRGQRTQYRFFHSHDGSNSWCALPNYDDRGMTVKEAEIWLHAYLMGHGAGKRELRSAMRKIKARDADADVCTVMGV